MEEIASPMTHPLDRLTGVSLAGKYRLEERLGAEGPAAWFRTSFGPRRERAALKLVPEDAASAERQLEWWRRAASLSHPNLLALLECGRVGAPSRPTDGSFLYAVFEYPDDNLARAQEEARGALTEEEARGVYEAASDALRYIHTQGLVHGAVDASHIVAVGDRVKLASDTLREPGPGATAAEDLRDLDGILLRRPSTPDAVPDTLSETERPQRMPRWTYAGLAAPAAALIAVLFARTPDPREPDPSMAPAPATAPVSKGSALPGPVPARVRTAPPPAKSEPAAVPAPATPPPRVWRVIAYTYAGFRDADGKARRINEKWPAFRAEVLAPNGLDRGPYLVALGGPMTRPEAERLWQAARSSGLPRDTFVRNFTE